MTTVFDEVVENGDKSEKKEEMQPEFFSFAKALLPGSTLKIAVDKGLDIKQGEEIFSGGKKIGTLSFVFGKYTLDNYTVAIIDITERVELND